MANGNNGHGRNGKRGRKPGNGQHGRGKTQPGPLTPNGSNGKDGHNESVATLAQALRRQRAVDLHVHHGMTLAQIAAVLAREGITVSPKTICLDLRRAMDDANRLTAVTVQRGQRMQDMRLELQYRQLLPLALGQLPPGTVRTIGTGKKRRVVTVPLDGERQVRLRLEAMSLLLRVNESRRRLFGWDEQPDAGISESQVASAMRGMLQDFMELVADNIDLRRQIVQVVRRHGGLLSPPPDVAGETVSDTDAEPDDADGSVEP